MVLIDQYAGLIPGAATGRAYDARPRDGSFSREPRKHQRNRGLSVASALLVASSAPKACSNSNNFRLCWLEF